MVIKKCSKCGMILGTRPNTVDDGSGVCFACQNAEKKKTINFKERQKWLTEYIKENNIDFNVWKTFAILYRKNMV